MTTGKLREPGVVRGGNRRQALDTKRRQALEAYVDRPAPTLIEVQKTLYQIQIESLERELKQDHRRSGWLNRLRFRLRIWSLRRSARHYGLDGHSKEA